MEVHLQKEKNLVTIDGWTEIKQQLKAQLVGGLNCQVLHRRPKAKLLERCRKNEYYCITKRSNTELGLPLGNHQLQQKFHSQNNALLFAVSLSSFIVSVSSLTTGPTSVSIFVTFGFD